MRQAGVIAAGALYALDHHRDRLAEDHDHARLLGAAVRQAEGLHLCSGKVDTNIVMFDVDEALGTAVSFVAALAYWYLEKRTPPPVAASEQKSDRIDWRHILSFNRSYWYILALCVLFYSVIFPFRSTFAIKYFQHAHGLDLDDAATINSYVFLAAVFITPIFGALVDRIGRRALFMVFGSLLLPLSFVALLLSDWGLWLTTVLLGVSFSLIPAVLWPAVALIVPAARLGTAYGLMTMIQAIGLTAANLIAGWLNDRAGAGVDNPDGYLPMLVFFGGTALLAFVFAVLLWRRETGPDAHGLESARHTDARPVPGPV